MLGSYFRKTLADANSPVQEKALDALIAFLRAADADAARLLLNGAFVKLSVVEILYKFAVFLSGGV